jgi:hypothetical protein
MPGTNIARSAIVSQCCLVAAMLFPSSARASGVALGNFKFEFYGVATFGALIGAFCLWLGYRLFTQGIQRGKGHLDFKSKFFSLVFSGTGPGLFFMAFGALIVLVAVVVATVASSAK